MAPHRMISGPRWKNSTRSTCQRLRLGTAAKSKSPHLSSFVREPFCRGDRRNNPRKCPWTWRERRRLNGSVIRVILKCLKIKPVINEPLADGLSMPNMATTMVIMPIKPIWIPEPINAHKMVDCAGGRKMSPWTSFQPVSSSVSSSSSSSLLYWAMSRRKVRTVKNWLDFSKTQVERYDKKLFFCKTDKLTDNHSQDTGQKKDDDNWVDNWEPMNLNIAHLEICVPARCPSDIGHFPADFKMVLTKTLK